MAKFVTPRDIQFIHSINRELVSDIVETTVIIYKIVIEQSTPNIYGESINKTYYTGIKMPCLIKRDEKTIISDFKTIDTNQSIRFNFFRKDLEESKTYPEVGDIIGFDSSYYEIDNISENQLVAGQPLYTHSIVCIAHLTNRSNIQIDEPNR